MLRISKKADYAVFLLGAIARAGAYPGGSAEAAVVSAQEIARQARLNKSVVANLLKDFARHGLLESVRGLKGGYRLARAPAEISLGDILQIVEGRFVLVDCVVHDATIPPGGGLLALAPSMNRDGKAAAGEHAHDAEHDCSLIAFCPSKAPMRIVHQRISQLFREIRLDELCSLLPTAPAAAAGGAAALPARR